MIRKSLAGAWLAVGIIVILTIVAVATRVVASVWEYSTLFLAFMAAFCHLMSLSLNKMSISASKKLELIAGIFGVLAIIAFIVIFILDWC